MVAALVRVTRGHRSARSGIAADKQLFEAILRSAWPRRDSGPEIATASGSWNSYLSLLHSFLHAADVAVHCATHAPDNPQFRAQEKLFESQIETHSANVWFCASRSLSMNVAASLVVIADRSNRNAIAYLMGSFPPDVGLAESSTR